MRTERWNNGVLVEVIEKPDDKERMLLAERATVNAMALDGELLLTEVDAEYLQRKATVEALPAIRDRHLVRDESNGKLVERTR